MTADSHLALPRTLVLFICGGTGPCPLPEKVYIDVLVEEPLPEGAEALQRVELRWPETGEKLAVFECTEGPRPRDGTRWFVCWCNRESLEAVEWPWDSLTVDMDGCGDLEEAGPGGETPEDPVVVYGPVEAGMVAVACRPGERGGRVCVAGHGGEGGGAYGEATCFVGGFEGFLPAHQGLQWAFYGDGGVRCWYRRCPGSGGNPPVPVTVAYVFYRPNVEVEVVADGLVFVVRVLPPSGPIDVLGGCASLF